MDHLRRIDPDAEVLSDRTAERLLARASELDAVRKAGATVAELRAAAAEAGIANDVFDAALAELRDEAQMPVPVAPRVPMLQRQRRWALAVTAAVLMAVGVAGVARTVPADAGVPAAPPMVEEPVQLGCLSAGHAMQLVRPLLHQKMNTVVHDPRAPGVLMIRATPGQLARVRAMIEQESAARADCAAPGSQGATRR